MSEPTDTDLEDSMLEEASAWFLRLEAGDETAFDGFEQWLMTDLRHAVAFRDVEAAWSAVGRHAAKPELLIGRRDALARAGRVARRRFSDSPWPKDKRTHRLSMAAAAAVLLAVALAPRAIVVDEIPSVAMLPVVYETAFGESRSLTLPDNSRLSLDAQSTVAVSVTRSGRAVELLRGQAYFEVVKDPTRPFTVKAMSRKVIALGTEFNVAVDNRNVSVTLVEGRVAVEETGTTAAAATPVSYSLKPGDQLHIDEDGNATKRRLPDVMAATAWRRGKLVFRNDLLGDAVEQINRYSRKRIVIGDASTARIRVSGVFNLGDADAFADAVHTYFNVRVDRREDLSVVLRSQPEG